MTVCLEGIEESCPSSEREANEAKGQRISDQTEHSNQSEPAKFDAILQEHSGVFVVSAHGELDIKSSAKLKALLDEAIEQCISVGGVVADLSHVEFMESVTLGVLVEQREGLRSHDKELALVIQQAGDDAGSAEEHPVDRLLNLSGQAGEFRVYDNRRSAVEDMAAKGEGPSEVGSPTSPRLS